MATPALIGLGSNLGDRPAHLGRAIAALSSTPGVTVRAVSSYHETTPVGGPGGQGAFLNAAAALETTLEPVALLDVLHAVEAEAGRVRTVRWGERTLDLDLLLFGDAVIRTDRLRVPHPRMALRRFVLAPLAEVAPEAVDPVIGRSIRGLLANLDRRPSYVALNADHRNLPPFTLVVRAGLSPSLLGLEAGDLGTAAKLHDRLQRGLSAASVVDRELELFRSRPASRPPPANMSFEDWVRLSAEARDSAYWTSKMPPDGWVVSPSWFDRFLLAGTIPDLDIVLHPRQRERFLALREKVLPATFVVVCTDDLERLRLDDPRNNWRGRIGWDTPMLEVADFESESTFQDVMAACAATRAG